MLKLFVRFSIGVRKLWKVFSILLAAAMLSAPACRWHAPLVSDEISFAAAEQKRCLGTPKTLAEAQAIYEALLSEALRTQSSQTALDALLKANEIDLMLFKPQAALARVDRLHSLNTPLPPENYLRLMAGRAVAYLVSGNFSQAESLLITTLCAQVYTLSDPQARAEIHQALGQYNYQRGLHAAAIAEYSVSLRDWEECGDKRGQAWVKLRRGKVLSDLGQTKEAMEALQEAAADWATLNDQHALAETHAALGRLHTRRGDQQAALLEFKEAETLVTRCDDKFGKADVLSGQGWVYETMGEYAKAQERYQNALGLFTDLGYLHGQTQMWHELGHAYYLQENYEQAKHSFTQFHELAKTMRNERFQAYALSGLGMTLSKTLAKAEALQAYQTALPILKSSKDDRGVAYVLNLMGQLYEEQHQLEAAQQALSQSLEYSLKVEDSVRESLTHYQLARVLWRQGNRDVAQNHVNQALKLIETLRTKVTRQDLRTSLLASVQPVYELALQLAMERGAQHAAKKPKADAFHLVERARARSLLDTLNEARVLDLSQTTPALLIKQRDLQQRLNAASDPKAIAQLIEERNDVEAQIRESHPQYAILAHPEPLTLPQVQAQLDEQTLLLEYALGETQSFVWAVTRRSWQVYPLAPRAQIEKAALAMLDMLRPDQPMQGKSRLQALEESATKLSALLLAPVARHLRARPLLIVPDGALQYVPFAAMAQLSQTGSPSSETFQPLMLEHEISYLPSASALALLRTQPLRQRARDANIYVFADPIFSPQDERWLKDTLGKQRHQANQFSALRAGTAGDDTASLVRLQETAREAKSIVELVPTASVRQGKEATVEAFKALPAQHHRIVHLATHARPDRENADLSTIFFSAVNERDQLCSPRISLAEIYQLSWSAELVVLSACETALGQDVKGEGLVNLARGFMYAGSPRILASLWKVEDQAAYELMKSFYHQHLSGGQSPRAALRAAQISLWQNVAWHAPWHWAAFTLQGEFQ